MALLAPWLGVGSVIALAVVAVLKELVRSVVFHLEARWPERQLALESALLATHLCLLLGWLSVFGGTHWSEPAPGLRGTILSPSLGPHLVALQGIIFALGGGTVFIRRLLSQLGKSNERPHETADVKIPASIASTKETQRPDREKAFEDAQAVSSDVLGVGQWIGNLERTLIFCLGLGGHLEAVGLVLAAKSLARFKELEDKAFSEYYLLGTLSSTLFALLAVWLTRITTSFFFATTGSGP